MKQLSLVEKQAARIVAVLSDCAYERLDLGGGAEPLADFELRDHRQGRLGILEVTSTVVGELAAFQQARGKYPILDARLQCVWYLVMRSAGVNLKALRPKLLPLILEAERKGTVSQVLEVGVNFALGEEPETALSKLGVWMLTARPAPRGRGGSIRVKPPAQGGGIGLEMVTVAVEAELNRPDNLVKLAKVFLGERAELFVWLDGPAGMALATPRLIPQHPSSYPTDGPRLPHPVTRVWAATGANDTDVLARALWVADGGEWRVVQPPLRLA